MARSVRIIGVIIFALIGMLLPPGVQTVAAIPKYEYNDIMPFKVLLPEGEKYGYIVIASGKWAIMPQFDKADYFTKDSELAAVKIGEKFGYIDLSGKVVIPPQYDEAWLWSEGLARVEVDGKYGFIDRKGKMVIAPQPYWVGSFYEGRAIILVGYKTGFIDKSGNLIIELKNRGFAPGIFREGLVASAVGNKYGFINKSGDYVIAPQFERVDGHFKEGLAPVRTGGKYGFIDKNGTMVISPRFDYAGDFENGLAGVMINNKIGFIDKKGKMVIAPQFEYSEGRWPQIGFAIANNFSRGTATVKSNGKYGVIDKKGNWVVQPIFGGFVPYYWPRQKLVLAQGYIHDVYGNRLNHYANHMQAGYEQLKNKDAEGAIVSFQAALKLASGDEAAKYGLSQAKTAKR